MLLHTIIPHECVADRLPTWKSGLLNKAGRVALAKSTLAAIPIHLSIAIGLPRWAVSIIEKLMKGFVWQGTATASQGQCTVAWDKVCRPTDMGGLGIPNLTRLGYALRLRWEWLRRTDASRTWIHMPQTSEPIVQKFFSISVISTVGDGKNTLFWHDRLLKGKSIEQLAPHVFQGVPPRIRKTRLVHDALQDELWIQDITGARTFPLIREFLQLWDIVQPINLTNDVPDKLIWRWTSSGTYSSASAYRMMFTGQYSIPGAKELHKTKAPTKVKFFMWLALLDRCWTSDRLARHHLNNSGPCALCGQAPESIEHLLFAYVFSREVWFKLLRPPGLQNMTPSPQATLPDWWLIGRKRLPKQQRQPFDSLVLLGCWEIWKERNRRVFTSTCMQPTELSAHIRAEGRNWISAGFSTLGDLLAG